NGRCLPEDVEAGRELLSEADILLLQLEIPLETVLTAARTAKELGKRVVLNPAPARELPDELYHLTDVITPNRSELGLLTGRPVEEEGLEAAMRELLDRGVGCVVTTLGARGAACLSPEGGFRRVEGIPVEVVDTTGAGDAFNAALACGLSEGMDLPAAVDFAGRTAALAVTRLGAQDGMPQRKEVEAFTMRLNGGRTVKKTTHLNSHLSRVISEMGHTDQLVVADAGLPIPVETERIDLAVRPGLPSFLETLEAVLTELEVEKVYVAEETRRISPHLHRALKEMFPETEWEVISHEALKEMTKKARAVVRTGECTPYANVILQSGVSF